ncbi:hypothetical protein JCM10908_005322 [Rhodotorula pacifica]|uniref:uncharacterized protein n=1 Tax=Rhodotorula pacifica TaxID=1495444 RepID=UPI003174FCDD
MAGMSIDSSQLGPFLLALLALVLLPRVIALLSADKHTLPVYGPAYLPRFVRGILALYRLGADEDGFLLELRREYPVAVWIPWPMCQTFVVGSEAIDQVYKAPSKTLSFFPIRREMQGTAFGADYWDDRTLMDGQFFPVHARGMSKNNLTAPLARFVSTVREKLDQLSTRVNAAPDDRVTLELVAWTLEAFYDGTLAGFFGPKVLDARGTTKAELYEALETYDRAFPIIASGLVPPALVERIPDVKKARVAQHVLAATFSDWIADGFEGLEEGVVRDMARVALDNDLGDYEAGKMLVADFWASMANAPFIAVRLLVTLLQAPSDLRADLQREIDSAMNGLASDGVQNGQEMTFAYLTQSLPLLGSCITETMRLETSTLSIRVVEKDIALTSDAKAARQSTVIVPANSRLVNVTRLHHLNDARWDGNASEWDGRRFFDGGANADDIVDEEKESGWRSKRAREVYGFGGGISRCEGQHIATAELKVLVAVLLHNFDVKIIVHRDSPDAEKLFKPIRFAGRGEQGWRPKPLDGRVGMGAYQLPREARIDMRVKRRKGR